MSSGPDHLPGFCVPSLPRPPLLTDDASGLLFRRRLPRDDGCRGRVLMLHGLGGNVATFDIVDDILPGDLERIWVQAPDVVGPGQYSWYPVELRPPEPVHDHAQALARRDQVVLLMEALDAEARRPTVVVGFGQGGVLAASVALSHPTLLEGFAMLASRMPAELEDEVAPTDQLQHLHAFLAHGRFDHTIPYRLAEQSQAWLDDLEVHTELHCSDVGHRLTAGELGKVSRWLARIWPPSPAPRKRRPPKPRS